MQVRAFSARRFPGTSRVIARTMTGTFEPYEIAVWASRPQRSALVVRVYFVSARAVLSPSWSPSRRYQPAPGSEDANSDRFPRPRAGAATTVASNATSPRYERRTSRGRSIQVPWRRAFPKACARARPTVCFLSRWRAAQALASSFVISQYSKPGSGFITSIRRRYVL